MYITSNVNRKLKNKYSGFENFYFKYLYLNKIGIYSQPLKIKKNTNYVRNRRNCWPTI